MDGQLMCDAREPVVAIRLNGGRWGHGKQQSLCLEKTITSRCTRVGTSCVGQSDRSSDSCRPRERVTTKDCGGAIIVVPCGCQIALSPRSLRSPARISPHHNSSADKLSCGICAACHLRLATSSLRTAANTRSAGTLGSALADW